MYRRMMVRAASRIAAAEGSAALVTGEFTDAARQSVDEASWRLAGMSVLILAAAAVLAVPDRFRLSQ